MSLKLKNVYLSEISLHPDDIDLSLKGAAAVKDGMFGLDNETLMRIIEMDAIGIRNHGDIVNILETVKPIAAEFVHDLWSMMHMWVDRHSDQISPEMLSSSTVNKMLRRNGAYLVLMMLRGEGVGIEDGDWDGFFKNPNTALPQLKKFLQTTLSHYADVTGGGKLNDALRGDLFVDESDDGLQEANKSRKTEHSGSKKGKGAYYGRKKDAKQHSKKARREQDKKELVVKELKIPFTNLEVKPVEEPKVFEVEINIPSSLSWEEKKELWKDLDNPKLLGDRERRKILMSLSNLEEFSKGKPSFALVLKLSNEEKLKSFLQFLKKYEKKKPNLLKGSKLLEKLGQSSTARQGNKGKKVARKLKKYLDKLVNLELVDFNEAVAVKKHVNESIERELVIDIPYDAYVVLQRYWEGQGDPLYAVLSRYKGRPLMASESELNRLYDATDKALEDNFYSENEEDMLTDSERFELMDFSETLRRMLGN